jgi:hypothetical protein
MTPIYSWFLGDAVRLSQDAQRTIDCPDGRRSGASRKDRTQSQQPAEACVAGGDRAADRGRCRHHGDRARVGKDKTVVWRWQQRFVQQGVTGLTRDKTRPSRIAPLPAATVDRVIELTNQAPPHQSLPLA